MAPWPNYQKTKTSPESTTNIKAPVIGVIVGAGHRVTMESTASDQKIVTNLPKLPAVYAWHIIEAHHAGGTTFWLRITDDLWQVVARFGWRTGYVPTSEQLIHRAKLMMAKLDIEESDTDESQDDAQ